MIDNKETNVQVTYKGFNSNLDSKIIKCLECDQLEYYAQGYNLKTNKRDINFIYKDKIGE